MKAFIRFLRGFFYALGWRISRLVRFQSPREDTDKAVLLELKTSGKEFDRSLAADMEQLYAVQMQELAQLEAGGVPRDTIAQHPRVLFLEKALSQVEEFATRRRLLFGEFLAQLPTLESPDLWKIPLQQRHLLQLKVQVESLTADGITFKVQCQRAHASWAQKKSAAGSAQLL